MIAEQVGLCFYGSCLSGYSRGVDPLDQLLMENAVFTHSIVIGELSCGNLKNRLKPLGDLKLIPAKINTALIAVS
jgi:predicted nucleic acid-binding protein